MFCTNCGNSVPDDSNFCVNCGARIQPLQSNAAPVQQANNGPYHLYMDAKGLTLLNYKFDIKSEDGSLRYRAATVTESLVSYNARVYNPDDTEDMPMNSVVRATIASVSPAFL